MTIFDRLSLKTLLFRKNGGVTLQELLKLLFLSMLVVLVLAEGYYIIKLENLIDRQAEELSIISRKLQLLKNERTALNEELLSLINLPGDNANGNTTER